MTETTIHASQMSNEAITEEGAEVAGVVAFGRRVREETRRRERRLASHRVVRIDLLGAQHVPHPMPHQMSHAELSGPKDEPVDVCLVDVSSRGVAMEAGRALRPGHRFSLSLKTSRGRVALFYLVRNVARAEGAKWRIGAEQIGVLGREGADRPEAVIMALLMGQCEALADA